MHLGGRLLAHKCKFLRSSIISRLPPLILTFIGVMDSCHKWHTIPGYLLQCNVYPWGNYTSLKQIKTNKKHSHFHRKFNSQFGKSAAKWCSDDIGQFLSSGAPASVMNILGEQWYYPHHNTPPSFLLQVLYYTAVSAHEIPGTISRWCSQISPWSLRFDDGCYIHIAA